MKKFLSLVLALVMTMSLVTVSAGATFEDDDAIHYVEAVEVMKAIEVVDGYADGKFNPANVLTRQAAAKIICNLILGPTTAEALVATTAPYSDVAADSQFAGYIAYCKQTGIISGYADGTFKPTNTLTGYAFCKMLLGALGYDQDVEGFVGENWKVNVAKLALSLGFDDGLIGAFNGNKSVNREEACLYALNMLDCSMIKYGFVGVKTAMPIGVTFMETYFKNLAKADENTMDFDDEDDAEDNEDVVAVVADAWGRKSYCQYYLKNSKGVYEPIVFIPAELLTSFNDSKSECEICKDLGESKKAEMEVVWVDGEEDTEGLTFTATETKEVYEGRGTQVEIYETYELNDGKKTTQYEAVVIHTYLAKVTDIVELEKDANGHVETEAAITFTAYVTGEEVTLTSSKKDFAYEEDDLILVNVNAADDEDSVILGLAKTEVLEPTATKDTGVDEIEDSYFKVGSKTYKYTDAHTYAGVITEDPEIIDEDGILDEASHDEKIVVYYDQFGNVIAVGEPEESTVSGAYVVLDADVVKAGAKAWYVAVKAVDENGKEVTLKVGQPEESDWGGAAGTAFDSTADAQAYADELEDEAVYQLIKATETKKYMKVEPAEGTATLDNGEIVKGDANYFVDLDVDSETIFMVAKYDKDGDETGKYDVYKGIKKVPSMILNTACASDEIVVTYVTMNAGEKDQYYVVLVEYAKKYTTSSTIETTDATSNYFFVTDMIPEKTNVPYYEYKALVNGKETTVRVDKEIPVDVGCVYHIEKYEEESGKRFIAEVTDCDSVEIEKIENEIAYTDGAKVTLADDCKIVDLDGKAVKASKVDATYTAYIVTEAKSDYAAYIYVVPAEG